MNYEDLHFVTQEINCTCKWECFWYEILTRVWKSRKSIELVLNKINEKEREDLDLLILKKILTDVEKFPKKFININIHIGTLINKDSINILKKLVKIWLKINIEILETTIVDHNKDFFNIVNEKILFLQNKWINIWLDDYPDGNTKVLLKKLKNLDFIKIDKQILLKKNKVFVKIINKHINEIKRYHKDALIVIEWVEEWKYINLLLELWVDAFQWYYFWKPKDL